LNKEEIRQFKSILRQGILRKMNVSLDYKFQKALLKIIKDYEQLETNRDVLKEYIQELRYNIEPEGVRINFNCEYDSEEDYIRGMEEQSRLETLKEILSKMQELERGKE
jgi:hypothetical protein